MNNSLNLVESFKSAWSSFTRNANIFVLVTLIFLILTILLGSADESRAYAPIPGVTNTLVSFFASYIMVRLSLTVARGGKALWKDVFVIRWSEFGWYVLAAIVTGVISALGLVLLIIPGLFIITRLALSNFAMIDEGLKPIESIKRSWALTRGYFWQMFLAGIVIVGLNIVGTALLGIGVLVSSPVSFLFSAYIYEKLREASVPVVVEKIA